MKNLYETDFYLWSLCQSEKLKENRKNILKVDDSIDIDNMIEEIESLGKSDKRAFESQITRIMTHLLKIDAQPHNNHKGWNSTIRSARKDLNKILRDSPSFKTLAEEHFLDECYKDALAWAVDETGIDESEFPSSCPWSLNEILGNK